MNLKSFFSNDNLIFFKRWINKPFAVFNTLKKIIIILVLPVIYLQSFTFFSFSQQNINLNEIVINSPQRSILFNENFRVVKIITKIEIANSTANNISDLLKFSMGVDVRQRGADEIQADISVRGGTFDQTLILINGIPISDPQTGHHSLNIPLDFSSIQQIEILQGEGSRLYGINAYSGAINFITKPTNENSISSNFSFGENNYFSGTIASNFKIGNTKNLLSSSYKKTNGYNENSDFKLFKLFFHSTYAKQNSDFNVQSGLTFKEFGALNFYTPKYPYQFEAVNNYFASFTFENKKIFNKKISVYYRYNQDKFELFRENDNWYKHIGNYWIRNIDDTAKFANSYASWAYYLGHNYHITNILGTNLSTNYSSLFGKTSILFDYKNISIYSNILGDESDSIKVPFNENTWFTKYKQQSNYSLHFDQYKKIDFFSISAGINLNYNTIFKFYYTYGVDLGFEITANSSISSSINQGIRLPTFTDLYYKGPSNIGNINLKPEKSTNYEISYKFINKNIMLQSAIFYRNGKNTIDWVKKETETTWQTMNYTEINTMGFDFTTKLFIGEIFNNNLLKIIDFNYSYLYIDKIENEFISRYVLDYLIHNLSLSTFHQITKKLFLTWNFSYKFRNGSYSYYNSETSNIEEVNYSPYWLLDAKIKYNLKISLFL